MDQIESLTDEALAVKVREENQELFSGIIFRYEKKLNRYLKRFFPDEGDRQDILQTVFIKAFRNLFGFDSSRKFSSWIYRIAHNEAVNALKKNFRQTIFFDDVEYKMIDEKIDLPSGLGDKMAKEKVSQALGGLKAKYREPMILFYFEERSYEEIGEILKIPKNSVGVLISRGREKLKEIISA